mgnify:CR=1 FL=1
MNPVFADTAYFVAVVNARDPWHALALKAGVTIQGPILTTEFVLVEFGNALSSARDRQLFIDFVEFMKSEPRFEILPASTELMEVGFVLYSGRPDKNWSMTDCISFAAMKERQITDVLTTDHHFMQAGFNVLMKP